MKKTVFLLIISIGLISCGKSSTFTLRATLDGIEDNSHVLIVYDDPSSKLDTIYPQNGKFTYQITPDTTILFRLLSSEGEIIPIVAEPSQEITIKGSFQTPVIQGEGENGEYGKFMEAISKLSDKLPAIQKEAENFILSHPQSFISAYLINQYFVQVPDPDPDKIEKLIKPLSGNVKDCRIMGVILKSLDPQTGRTSSQDQVNYFSCKDRNGKYTSWNNDKDGYTLLNFWASWDRTSCEKRDSIYTKIKDLPKNKLKVINISLDYNKDNWISACKEDSELWVESCDYKGWSNQLVKQNRINELPANILIDHNRKIIMKNLYGNALYNKVMDLTKKK